MSKKLSQQLKMFDFCGSKLVLIYYFPRLLNLFISDPGTYIRETGWIQKIFLWKHQRHHKFRVSHIPRKEKKLTFPIPPAIKINL